MAAALVPRFIDAPAGELWRYVTTNAIKASASDILTSLTAFTVSLYRNPPEPDRSLRDFYDRMWMPDEVLRAAQRATPLMLDSAPGFADLVDLVFAEPEFDTLAKRAGELDPMLFVGGSGTRMAPESLLAGLFAAATLQMYLLDQPRDEGTFVRTVLENFDELRRAARGEKIRAHVLTGLSGLTLTAGIQINTPWGTLRSSPKMDNPLRAWGERPQTTAILAESKLLTVIVDRAASPQVEPRQQEVSTDRASVLLPLACALASKDRQKPSAPLVTWNTVLLPFSSGLGYSMPHLPPIYREQSDMDGSVPELEEWCRIVEGAHDAAVEIAAKRLVSAVSLRTDATDALIDAVMVWENLVGTSAETTFRVTASLAKALEPDRSKRRAFRKALARVYDVRSRVVHGALHGAPEIAEATSTAKEVAIGMLAFSYRKGREWLKLSSSERADILLLEES